MKSNLTKFALSASIMLAMAFTLSCSSDDENNDGGGGGGDGGSLSYQGKDYKTVVIGSQTWLAENLNYNVSGSVCYDNLESNCNIYGRLYDWATAMGIAVKYNSENWNGSDVKHQGICPSGWHIPNNTEWDNLYHYADGTSGTESPYGSPTAGKYLKAKELWLPNNGTPSIGEDKFGFSALPGGDYNNGVFNVLGEYGNWWSSSEPIEYNNENNVNYAHFRRLTQGDKGGWNTNTKSRFLSVRCVKN